MALTSFVTMLLSASFLLIPLAFRRRLVIQQCPVWFRFGVYYALLLAIATLSVYDDLGFVYFQF